MRQMTILIRTFRAIVLAIIGIVIIVACNPGSRNGGSGSGEPKAALATIHLRWELTQLQDVDWDVIWFGEFIPPINPEDVGPEVGSTEGFIDTVNYKGHSQAISVGQYHFTVTFMVGNLRPGTWKLGYSAPEWNDCDVQFDVGDTKTVYFTRGIVNCNVGSEFP